MATDAFTGADGTALTTYSASWTLNAGNFVLNTNTVTANDSAAECGAHWNGTFGDDHSSQGIITSVAGATLIGVSVRCKSDGSANYYGCYGDASLSQTFKMVAGTWTQIGSDTGAFAVNDIIYIEANGNTLTSKQNGTNLSSTTQNDLITGKPGLAGYNLSIGMRLDDWVGLDLAVKLYIRNVALGNSYALLSTPGTVVDSVVVVTTASGTEILAAQWVSGRVPAGGLTLISINASVWAVESVATVNAGLRLRIFKLESDGTETELAGGPFDDGVELTINDAEYTWTANPTDTFFAENDRVLLKFYITNIGTMDVGDVTLWFNNADTSEGDSFVSITPTVTFKEEGSLSSAYYTQSRSSVPLGVTIG